MATILVTGAGGACGIGAIDSLSTAGHQVVGVDMEPDAVGLYRADHGATVPAAADADWPKAMAAVVRAFDVDVIIPTVDEELAVLPALTEVLDEIGETVPVIAPAQRVIDLSMDKYQTMKQLSAAGHPTPQTWLATEADEIDPALFPLIVKPRQGRGSRGVRRVATPAELAAYLDETAADPDTLLCQRFVDGTEYTTSVVATGNNRLLSVVPKEAIEKNGSTVRGATRKAPAVAESCTALFETLQPAGPINVQQIVGDDGVPRVIEINPRFSSTSSLTAAAGVNEFDLLVRDALGEPVDPPAGFEADRYLLRFQQTMFLDKNTFDGERFSDIVAHEELAGISPESDIVSGD